MHTLGMNNKFLSSLFFHGIISFFMAIYCPQVLWGVAGWNPPMAVDGGVHDYKLDTDKQTGSMVLVTQKIRGAFSANAPTMIDLNVFFTRDGRQSSIIAHTVELKPSPALFPVNADIAVAGAKSVLVWQKTDFSSGKTIIEYKSTENGVEALARPESGVKRLDLDGVLVLPQLETDHSGNIYLFFQKENSANVFTFYRAMMKKGSFGDFQMLVKDIHFIGRGAFFPSVSVSGNQMHVFYQSRGQNSLKDNIHYFKISGSDRSDIQKLTSSDYHNFSPRAAIFGNTVHWVWQANPEKNWEIFYQSFNSAARKISTTNASCYNPQIAYSKKTGRIIVWSDHRKNPPQIFGIFMDRQENELVGVSHQISDVRYDAKKPFLFSSSYVDLYYLAGGVLYRQHVDTEAEKLIISSRTHPERKAVSRNSASFSWKLPNDPSGVQGYAFLVDKSAGTNPDLYNLPGTKTGLSIDYMEPGVYYLHLRYMDKAGNESETSHYNFIIDSGPPGVPDISSPTHKERVGSKARNVVFNFLSKDDIEVIRYHYSFLPYITTKLEKSTEKNQVIFNNVEPGTYYFRITAEDIAGNRSAYGNFTVIIDPENSGSVFDIFSNITDGEVRNNQLDFSIPSQGEGKTISKVFFSLGKNPSDPYMEKFIVQTSSREGNLVFSRNIENIPKGQVYVVSVGVEYSDKGKSSVKHIYFSRAEEITNVLPEEDPIAPTEGPKASLESGEIYSHLPNLDKPPAVKPLPRILVSPENGYFEVRFFAPEHYKYVMHGFSWEISSRQRMPGLEVNSHGQAEYLYNLKPGEYYINVRLILHDNKLTETGYYSSYRLNVVKNREGSSNTILWIVVVILALVPVYLLRRRLYFILSRFIKI